MSGWKKLAAAPAGGGGLDVDEVFSAFSYQGTGSNKSISNGIDLSGEGGMIWTKCRTSALDNIIYDTDRSFNRLQPQLTAGEGTYSGGISSYNSDGYSMGNGNNVNSNGDKLVSWTFRKAPKFFDVQTFTTTYNVDPNVISHDLDGELGCAIFKQRDTATQGYNWVVYHRSLGLNKYLKLNSSAGSVSDTNSFEAVNNSAGTISVGYPMSDAASRIVRGDQETSNWVGYFFAHNNGDGEFGPDGDQDIIKCGSYTGAGHSGVTVNLGFEPQFIMIKRSNSSALWTIIDATRGMVSGGNSNVLYPNSSQVEADPQSNAKVYPTTTGLFIEDDAVEINSSGDTYIYVAIRRGPLAVPTDATKMFDVETLTVNNNLNGTFVSSSAGQADMLLTTQRSHQGLPNTYLIDTLRGGKKELQANNAASAETNRTSPYYYQIDLSEGLLDQWSYPAGSVTTPTIYWMWKRAPGYFDIVAYEGDGTANQTFSHGLTVKPGMVWIKNRNRGNTDYYVWVDDSITTLEGRLNSSGDFGYNVLGTVTDTTVQTLNTNQYATNYNGDNYIAYLFATLPGISKAGSYTGNGSSQTIDCGFSAGARFILVKRRDNTGDWYIWDTARGIVAGNDPYLRLNSTGAEVTNTDWVDPNNSGFIVNGTTINASGGNYIFYAIA